MQLSDDGHTLIKVNPADIPPDGHFNVPNTVNEIGPGAFHEGLFRRTRLTEVTFPEGLTKIGASAFRNCRGLTKVTFSEGLTQIGANAFSGCTSLIKITLPQGLTVIDFSAFRGCIGLTKVALPQGLTEINAYAFEDCIGLAEVTFPEGLTEIFGLAFKGCTGLQVMIINTQSDVELNRFKALLIEDLQDKVIDKARYEALSLQAKAFRPEALEPLCRIAEINPLLRLSHFNEKTMDEGCKIPTIHQDDIFFNINQFAGRSSEPYRAAEDEMKALSVPLDESQTTNYKNQLNLIVNHHVKYQKEKLKNTASTTASERAADAEVNTSDENGEDFECRSVKHRPG